jgi:ribonuclease HI
MPEKVIIYTDGSCLSNPGPGGIGIVLKFGSHRKEISKGYRKTTNNRMELLAVIEALKTLKRDKLEVEIYSDSNYVVHAVEKGWVFDWEKKNFKKKKNPDLWKEFLELYPLNKIKFRWVESHIGIPENEKCDQLAKMGAMNPTGIDQNYESESQSGTVE